MGVMKRALVKGFALCALNVLMATHVQAQLIEGCDAYQDGETFEVNQPGPVHLGVDFHAILTPVFHPILTPPVGV